MNIFKKLSALFVVSLTILAGCSGSSSSSPSSTTSQDPAKIKATASFFPIKWLVENIGGKHVTVTSATPTNVEPHDYEFSPKEVSKLSASDVVFYVKGFQPSLDQALTSLGTDKSVDLSIDAELVSHPDQARAWTNHGKGSEAQIDPHFWLDPVRMKKVAARITDALSKMDPDHATDYAANAKKIEDELTQLDADFSAKLATCKERAIVSSHAAFGYLTDRYKLVQLPITGLDPDSDPSPANLREIKMRMKDYKSTVIFSEILSSPKAAETLAQEVGAKTAKLDAMESDTTKKGYIAGMRANLESLHSNLQCE